MPRRKLDRGETHICRYAHSSYALSIKGIAHNQDCIDLGRALKRTADYFVVEQEKVQRIEQDQILKGYLLAFKTCEGAVQQSMSIHYGGRVSYCSGILPKVTILQIIEDRVYNLSGKEVSDRRTHLPRLKFLPDTSPTDDFQDMRRARMRESKAEVWDERQRKG